MKGTWGVWVLLLGLALVLAACASSSTMNPAEYERRVERQQREEFQKRLSY